jgi:DNA-binding CsgD family transcriptional regulator
MAPASGDTLSVMVASAAAAEAAWLQGDVEQIGPLTDDAWTLALSVDAKAHVGSLAWWRMLGGAVGGHGALADPFAAMLGGSWKEAAQDWSRRGSPVWAAYAQMLDPDIAAAESAVRALNSLGADAAVRAVLRTRKERGLGLPRRPRGVSADNPVGLTAREREVLRLLAQGLSTAQIAEELVMSPRTAEHHVSAVLRKFDAPSRAKAIAVAQAAGVLG